MKASSETDNQLTCERDREREEQDEERQRDRQRQRERDHHEVFNLQKKHHLDIEGRRDNEREREKGRKKKEKNVLCKDRGLREGEEIM